MFPMIVGILLLALGASELAHRLTINWWENTAVVGLATGACLVFAIASAIVCPAPWGPLAAAAFGGAFLGVIARVQSWKK